MTTRIRLSMLAMCALLLAPAMSMAAVRTSAVRTLTLGKGTEINAVMDSTLDSKTANVGDRFTMHVVQPFPQGYDDLDGAKVHGEVIKVTHANQGVKPEVVIAVNSVTLRDGSNYPLTGEITTMHPKEQHRNAARIAAMTIGGMIVGNILGKAIFHTNVGGAAGAAGGFAVGYNQKSDFQLQQGSTVGMTLTRSLVVRRQAHRRY